MRSGPAYIGFNFNYRGTTYYAWANVTLTTGGRYGTFTVNSWSCSSNDAFTVGTIDNTDYFAVPEPAEAALGLGALALGAAGLRRWRKASKAA